MPITTRNIILFMVISAFFSALPRALPADQSTGATAVRYEISSAGFNIGKAESSIRVTGDGGHEVVHFTNRTDIEASFLWIRCSIHSSEQATIKGGKLISYSRQENKKGVRVSVTGKLEGDRFRFEVADSGGKRTVDIPRAGYDYTTMECPEAFMKFDADGTRTVRVLDPEFMQVVERKYRLIRECSYKIEGKEFNCRIVDFEDPHKSCRRWIGFDRDAIIMFRQDGKNGRLPYSVRAAALDRIASPLETVPNMH